MDPGDPEASAGAEDGAGGRSAQTAEKGERLPAGCASLAATVPLEMMLTKRCLLRR